MRLTLLAILLSGCGGASPPAIATHGGSWMLPETKSGSLVYADSATTTDDYVFSYPNGKLVGTIVSDTLVQEGLCSDRKGNVFIVGLQSTGTGLGVINEYAHGATIPIQTLDEDGVWPYGCAVDPKTGDLAVASVNWVSASSYLDVYQNARGAPHEYYDPAIINYEFCGYDDNGNLFVDGTGAGSQIRFAELPRGGSSFVNFTLRKSIDIYHAAQVQWDGTHMTIEDSTKRAIYRLHFSGTAARVVGATHLRRWNVDALSWIQGDVALAPTGKRVPAIGIWQYPLGGRPIAKIATPTAVRSATISAAP
jgi:hypothetical protein